MSHQAPGSSLSRVIILHVESENCLYDRILPGDEPFWQLRSTKDDSNNIIGGIKFAVSGTHRDREQRARLVSLMHIFFQISNSIDKGNVFKACFQMPAINRQNNFMVKFTPHFGSLARPKKNINTKISSMVFGQSTIEMVLFSKTVEYTYDNEIKKGRFVCGVFYGQNCKQEISKRFCRELIDKFTKKYKSKLIELLLKLENIKNGKKEKKDEIKDDNFEISSLNISSSNMNKDKKDSDKKDTQLPQESIMTTYKDFDEYASRLHTRYLDRIQRRKSNSQKYYLKNINKKHIILPDNSDSDNDDEESSSTQNEEEFEINYNKEIDDTDVEE